MAERTRYMASVKPRHRSSCTYRLGIILYNKQVVPSNSVHQHAVPHYPSI